MAQNTVYALVDCANFYVSCERLFRPDLIEKPVVVLSNNDGCVVARSEEIKRLGIKMGTPLFKCRERLDAHQATVFSSNYSLYADLSNRVMQTLEGFTPAVDIYSIDEAFLELESASRTALLDLGKQITERVDQHIGIPVRVGMGPTKTLSKVASTKAKERYRIEPTTRPVAFIEPTDAYLDIFDVGKIWGIGPAYRQKLNQHGIAVAAQFRDAPDVWIKHHLTVVGLRTAHELRGHSCMHLQEAETPRKSLVRSRSFGRATSELNDVKAAIATHVSQAASRLRSEGLKARHLSIFATTKYHGSGPHRSIRQAARLMQATHDTPTLIRASVQLLHRCFISQTRAGEGLNYRKAGVMLTELVPEEMVQLNLFESAPQIDVKQAALMQVLDEINARFGRRSVQYATTMLGHRSTQRSGVNATADWQMKSQRRSPGYTTSWQDVPVVWL